MYRIGEFSLITKVPVKTLRYYHDCGLLEPDYIDDDSKYRYYKDAAIERLKRIKQLRLLDFSIAQIKELLEKDPEGQDIQSIVHKKLTEIQDKVRQYQEIEEELNILMTDFQVEQTSMQEKEKYQIQKITLEPILIAGIRFQGTYQEIGGKFKQLMKAVWRYQVGKPIGLDYDSEYKELDADIEAAIAVKKPVAIEGIHCRILPGGNALRVFHKGAYTELNSTYKKLFKYANENALVYVPPAREMYHKGPGFIFPRSAKKYITEIQLPVIAS